MDKAVLAEWNPWWTGKKEPPFVDRELTDKLLSWLKRKEIIGLLGVRRCGKTTLMLLLIHEVLKTTSEKNVFFIKCDDERVAKENLIDDCISTYKELINPKGRVYVFIDEIQEVNNWEKTLKRIYDLSEDVKLLITGSNFSMLKDELSSKLAGRIAYFTLYPFSFREFINNRMKLKDELSLFTKKSEIKHYFLEYSEFGAFPEVVLEKNETMKNQLIQFYYDTIIYRDIIKKREIRNAAKMEQMINILLQNISNNVNFTKIGKTVLLSTDTVVEYVKYLQDAFFIFTIPVFSYSLKTQEVNPKKVYCIDTGLRNAKGFRFSKDYGRLIENIVFIELKRRYSSSPLTEIFYWRDKDQKEVDFLVKDGIKIKQVIQVCWDLKENKEREVNNLITAMKELKLNEGLVITEYLESQEIIDSKKITFIPLWKWLLVSQS